MAKLIINPDRPFMLGLKDGLAGRNAPNNRGFGMGDLRNYAEGQRAAKERLTVQRFDNTIVFDGTAILCTQAGVGPADSPSFGCHTGGSVSDSGSSSDSGCGSSDGGGGGGGGD